MVIILPIERNGRIMSSLKLCRLISDGAVLQRRKSIHIWGWDEAGMQVTIKLENDITTAMCDASGRFDAYLPARESGGPYKLVVVDDKGEKVIVENILVGLVWLCTGQSNMELPLARTKDQYPEVVASDENDRIRTFKIVEETCYTGPYEELNTGSWVSVGRDTIMNLSATGYFFGKHLQELTGQPIGLINASLGGSRIYSWMSKEMLEGYDDLLEIADQYADSSFVEGQIKKNIENGDKWRGDLYKADKGISEKWHEDKLDISNWTDHKVPGFFKGTELDGFIGAVWFRREFDLPKELAGKQARLFMGTMVDSDIIYVNGQKVGETGYQYPPRKYDIPKGLTREKKNTIAIRLTVETGMGRFTENKELKIFNKDAAVYLDGIWKCKVGAIAKEIPATDFINWKPTGLYNAMTAPCHNFPIDGVIWYQGESNVEDGYDYADFTERMVGGYRKAWKEENLPFIAVQLPNFVIDQLPRTDDWGQFRLTQNKILDMPMTGLVVTMGLGEDNDLHPVVKEPVGERLALWAAHLKYGYNGEYTGPVATSVLMDNGEITVNLTHANGLTVQDAGKGLELQDFYVIDINGKRKKAKARLQDSSVVVESPFSEDKAKRLCWLSENTYHGGLITNSTGIPMSPFDLAIE